VDRRAATILCAVQREDRHGGGRAPAAGRWGPRLALVLASGVVAALAVEGVMFFAGPPIASYDKPYFRDEAGSLIQKMANVVHFRGDDADFERVPPSTQLKPKLRCWMCDDRPEHAYFDADGCTEIRTNRWGFRDDEFELEKPAGEWRILTIGDSFTFGLGVAQDDTWPQVLEELLQADREGPVQVINGGFAWMFEPSYYAEWVPTEGLAFQPDAVVVGLCLNDMGRGISMVAGPFAKPRPYWGGERWTPLVALRTWLAQRELEPLRVADYADKLRDDPQVWEETRAGLRTLRDALEPRGVRFVVAVLPMLSRLDADYPYRELHRIAREFCEAEGIEVVDLMDAFLGRDDRALWVHPTDQHPNDVGQRLIAEGIRRRLAR